MIFFGRPLPWRRGVSSFLLWVILGCFWWAGPPLAAALAAEEAPAGDDLSAPTGTWSATDGLAVKEDGGPKPGGSPVWIFLRSIIRSLTGFEDRPVPLEDLLAERDRLRKGIEGVRSAYDQYLDRELRPLTALRLEEMGLAEALLTRRIAALKSGADIELEASAWEPRPELAAQLAEEIELLEAEMRSGEEEATKYLGGPLLAELRLVQAQRGFTLAILRRHYLMAKYGLTSPAVKWAEPQEEVAAAASPAAAVWQSAGGVWLTKTEEGAVSRSIVTFAPGASEKERTALVIECLAGRLELYVGFSQLLEEARDVMMVEYRLGGETAGRKAVWDLSSDGRAVFARSADALLAELRQAETFSLTMTLRDQTRLTASFSLFGLAEALEPLRSACR